MPVPDQTPVNSSTANGVTTVFPYTFKILDDDDILVEVDGEEVDPSAYSVSGVGSDIGGNVTFITAPADQALVVRSRNMVIERTDIDYQEGGGFEADTVDEDADRNVMISQQLALAVKRALKAPRSVSDDQVFSEADWAVRHSSYPYFDSAGDLTFSAGTTTDAALRTDLAADTGSTLIGWIRAAASAVAVTLKRWLDWQVINVFEFMTVAQIADVQSRAQTLNVTTAVAAALTAALAAGRTLHFPAGTYLATLSVRANNATITGEGSAVTIIKHPNVTLTNVLELGDTASGNSATAYSGINVRGLTLDGNRAVVAAPASDLVGHGLPLTKISHFTIDDVRAINCHNSGVGIFINSNYGAASVYVENCGNATHTRPGFDINSSKYGIFNVRSKDCYDGGRMLDNCWGNHLRISISNTTKHGFIYNNQNTNESYNNDIQVTADVVGEHGMTIGPNCHNSNIRAAIRRSTDRGMSMALQNITAKTFDGSSAVVVVVGTERITVTAHGWTSGAKVMYSSGGGTPITGLTDGEHYWVIRIDNDTLKLATSAENAAAGTAVDLTAVGVGSSHSLTENLRPRGNNVVLTTERSQNIGAFIGGDSNFIVHTSVLDGRGGVQGSSFGTDVNGDRNMLVVTNMDSSPWHVRGLAVRAGATGNVIVAYQYDNTADPYNDAGTGTQRHGQTLSGSATFNPADLADGAGETTTVTVTGAALGDFAEASFSLDIAGITMTAWVSAANTVSVRFQNEAGAGNINLGSGTLRARVRKNI